MTVGPWTERGFFYDFDVKEPFTDKDLKKIRKEMQKIVRANLPFIREEVRRGGGLGTDADYPSPGQGCASGGTSGRGMLLIRPRALQGGAGNSGACKLPFIRAEIGYHVAA